MILHTLNKAPSSSDSLQRCLAAMAADDAVLLIENAVYAALADHPLSEKLALASCQGRAYA
ncbi:MAG TPA: DsrH/TusB family sulfur metabolism protein, partial [Pseudomonadales bacterium]|nr:DsrH/TusB family sulfur metabolism protein [Pseudomonadales bacterium]